MEETHNNNNNKIQLTFSGCGFLGIYHLGVVESFRSKVPNFLNKIDRVYGCSAGALVGVMLLCGISMNECLSITKEIVLELKELRLGPLNPTVKFREAMRKNFENMLPRDAHKIVSGKLFISCTCISSRENVIISDFNTRNELINVSCFLYILLFNSVPRFNIFPILRTVDSRDNYTRFMLLLFD